MTDREQPVADPRRTIQEPIPQPGEKPKDDTETHAYKTIVESKVAVNAKTEGMAGPPAGRKPAAGQPKAARKAPLSEARTQIIAGSELGTYRLVELLGEGGMGAVWKAVHTKLKKTVAVKVLPPALTRDAATVKRFEREMEAVGKLDHPNIVRAMDAGEIGGTHFLVTEFVDGFDLGKLVEMRGKRSIRESCEIIRQAAVGLAHAHQHGLVHRDIKPGNLLVEKPKGASSPLKVKILDLGLARLQGETGGAGKALTGMGLIMGTPDYMAPEQWEDTHSAESRADLYSLGCTLFFLLTGRAPFDDETHQSLVKKMAAHTAEPAPDLMKIRTDVPPELDAIYKKLLAKTPEARFATAAELVRALTPLAKGQTSSINAGGTAILPGQAVNTAAATTPATIDAGLGSVLAAIAAEELTEPTATKAAPTKSSDANKSTGAKSIAAGKENSGADKPPRKIPNSWLAAGGGAAALLLAGVIIIITTRDGKQVTIDAPDGATIKVPDGASVNVTSQGEKAKPAVPDPDPAKLPPNPPEKPTAAQTPAVAGAPARAVAPFDSEKAKQFQLAWAKYLKLPVEYTNSIGMKFVLIPPGQFLMGGTPKEIEERRAHWPPGHIEGESFARSEGPQHIVQLTKPFYMAMHEVTQKQYTEIAGANPSTFHPESPNEDGKKRTAGMDTSSHPVDSVGWAQTVEFCRKISEKESLVGTAYRLPTDAEWEYCSRAGTQTRYWTGDSSASLAGAEWVGQSLATKVGSLKPNPFGLFDMNGNVCEWANDYFSDTYYAEFAKTPAVDPQGPKSGLRRSIRGGCWYHDGERARAAVRNQDNNGNPAVGFRVVLPVDAVRDAASAGSSPDRRVALMVLRLGGKAATFSPGQKHDLTENDPLLDGNMVLDTISLDGVKGLTDAALAPLRDLKGLRTLSLNHNAQLSDAALEPLVELTTLQYLNLQGVPVTDKGLRKLSNLKQMKGMDLSRTKVTGSAFADLRGWDQLQSLLCQHAPISNPEMVHLKNFKALRHLALDNSPLNDEGMKGLAAVTELDDLSLAGTQVTSTGLIHISNLPKLEVVGLHSTQVDDTGLRHVAKMETLRTLNLWMTPITDKGLKHLSGLKNLSVLNLGHVPLTGVGFADIELPSLKILLLEGTSFNDAGLRQVERFETLEIVSLNKSKVTDAGLLKLKGLPNLKELQLNEMPIKSSTFEALRKQFPKAQINGQPAAGG